MSRSSDRVETRELATANIDDFKKRTQWLDEYVDGVAKSLTASSIREENPRGHQDEHGSSKKRFL